MGQYTPAKKWLKYGHLMERDKRSFGKRGVGVARRLWPIDQTILLCVDQVVLHHCEKEKVERECAEEEERVEDQTTTGANET